VLLGTAISSSRGKPCSSAAVSRGKLRHIRPNGLDETAMNDIAYLASQLTYFGVVLSNVII